MITPDSGAHMQQLSRLMHKHGLAGSQDISISDFTRYCQMFPKGVKAIHYPPSLSSNSECHFPSYVSTVQATLGIREERNRLICTPK